MKEDNLIIHRLAGCYGAGEHSEVHLVADTTDGETYLEVKKTIIERYPITDYKKVMQLHEDLNRGGGRRVWSLKDLAK